MLGFNRIRTAVTKPVRRKKEVNWERMAELSDEVEDLIKKNLWTLEEYRRINQEALKAGGAEGGARDWLLCFAEEEWLKYILKSYSGNGSNRN